MVDSCKLFVGCLPYSKSEQDVAEVFAPFGELQEVALMKAGEKSKGCAFVTFVDERAAQTAAAAMANFLFPGSNRGLNIVYPAVNGGNRTAATAKKAIGGLPKHALDALSSQGCKLFVGRLPFSRTEHDIATLFGQYGMVAEVFLMTKGGEKTGAAFVTYYNPAHAQRAVAALNGYLFPGSSRPILVDLAGVPTAPVGGVKRTAQQMMGVPPPPPHEPPRGVPSAPLPHGWQATTSSDGRPYYYNIFSGAVQWQIPSASQASMP
mmetsp:Transcript_10619/g.25207  ORF Transcript_10619/g.25207 Transcript_10619/m.25207 type:complete len:264 (+) Transcript_10619:53-844(+)